MRERGEAGKPFIIFLIFILNSFYCFMIVEMTDISLTIGMAHR